MIHDNYDGTQYEEKVSLLHCKAKDVFLHTAQVEKKRTALALDVPNEPMPKECDLFEKPYFLK